MRHHSSLTQDDVESLLWQAPIAFTRESPRHEVAYGLGATLYVPPIRRGLEAAIRRRSAEGTTSVVVCLEDAVADVDLSAAECALAAFLDQVADDPNAFPLLFVRVRTAEQLQRVVADDAGRVLCGFALPKFDARRGRELMAAVEEAARQYRTPLYAMPILETPQLADPRSRIRELDNIGGLLAEHPNRTLAVRIGATDIASTLGLRRTRELTCYDVGVVRDVITDVRAVVGSDQELVPVVTGCVWEFFSDHAPRVFRPLLRESVFAERGASGLRGALLETDLDGLVRELALDKANGLQGKTVIHPSHVPLVHAIQTATHEEYVDARVVLGRDDGGVERSPYRNKMNELGPHRGWALAIDARARAFGVLRPGVHWVDLLKRLQGA